MQTHTHYWFYIMCTDIHITVHICWFFPPLYIPKLSLLWGFELLFFDADVRTCYEGPAQIT